MVDMKKEYCEPTITIVSLFADKSFATTTFIEADPENGDVLIDSGGLS